METTMQVMFWETLRVTAVSGLLVYALLAVGAYVKTGSGFKLSLNEGGLLGALANLLLWIGVKVISTAVALGRAFLNFLS